MIDNIHEQCGIFGIFESTQSDVATSAYLGLFALQHRGQNTCGIAVSDDGVFRHHKGFGLVSEVFSTDDIKKLGKANMAVGHVGSSSDSNINNVGPIVVRHIKGNLALAHNGNLTNASELRNYFELNGAIFHTTSDTEDIIYAIVSERLQSRSIENAVEMAMYKIKGAYSCCLMSPSKLIAFRDPNGFRPLCLGMTRTGGYVVASESAAIDSIGATFVRDVLPGEIIEISEEGLKSIKTHCKNINTLCVFEYIYFARKDSIIDGVSVYSGRKEAGAILAKEAPVDADVVIGVPDSGIDAAIGYSNQSKIPYAIGFVKNSYIGRSVGRIVSLFDNREFEVNNKLNVIKESVEGKKVVLIDDSIIMGTTSKRIVKLLKDNGAKEVHIRITSPALKYPCFFGSNINPKADLIANKYDSIDEIRDFIGADSLAYISIEGAHKIASDSGFKLCDGCFSGKYPIETPKNEEKNIFEQKINR